MSSFTLLLHTTIVTDDDGYDDQLSIHGGAHGTTFNDGRCIKQLAGRDEDSQKC